jgi:hypothetical protein
VSAADDFADPLRRLARERGSLLAEVGVRSDDGGWIRREADAVASLVVARRRRRYPRALERLWRRLERLIR